VGRTPRPCDDHLQTAISGIATVGQHLVGHPMRGNHIGLIGHIELLQGVGSSRHHRPV